MRIVNSFLTALALLPSFALAEEASDVVVLTESNFESFVKTEPLALVEFYAPWCGHCKQLAPKYEKAATELLGKAKLAKVDCTVESKICGDQDVKGYPTLKVLDNGTFTPYKEQRETEAIVSYMQKMTEPRISELNAEGVSTFLAANPISVVGYVTSKASAEYKLLEEAANLLFLSYSFAFTLDANAASKAGVSQPKLVLHKPFDGGVSIYDGELTVAALTAFLDVESLPLVGEIGPENYHKYAGLGLPIAYFFYKDDDQKKSGNLLMGSLADSFKGNFSFVLINSAYEQHGQLLGCKGEYPWFTLQNVSEGTKYPLHEPLTPESMTAHVIGVLSGSVPSYLKSEDVPESNDAPVKVVVGQTYPAIVQDLTKDVFLEIYAPWCGHCKKLAPTWDLLAESLKSLDSIVIAKMDGTLNDLPSDAGFEVSGFPTLVFVKAESNLVVAYDGDRSMEDLLKFIHDHALDGKTVPTTLPEGTPLDEEIVRDEL